MQKDDRAVANDIAQRPAVRGGLQQSRLQCGGEPGDAERTDAQKIAAAEAMRKVAEREHEGCSWRGSKDRWAGKSGGRNRSTAAYAMRREMSRENS
ncbi:MAG: hypothetical protein QM775_28015 [Pirellulales bacterium]